MNIQKKLTHKHNEPIGFYGCKLNFFEKCWDDSVDQERVLLLNLFIYYFYPTKSYTVFNFEIRRDVTSGRLRTQFAIKQACFAAIPYTSVFYGYSFEVRTTHSTRSNITSKIEIGQS